MMEKGEVISARNVDFPPNFSRSMMRESRPEAAVQLLNDEVEQLVAGRGERLGPGERS